MDNPTPALDPLTAFRAAKQGEFIGACQNLHAQYLVFTMQMQFDPAIAKTMLFHLEGIATIVRASVIPEPKPTALTKEAQPS